MMRTHTRLPLFAAALAAICLAPPTAALAQDVCVPSSGVDCDDPPTYVPTNELTLGFTDALTGDTFPSPKTWFEVLRQATLLEVEAPDAERVQFVAAIVDPDDGEILEHVVSRTFLMVPGKPKLVAQGHGPVDSPWDGYETPAFGFEADVYGYETPAFGYETPAFGYDNDEAASFDDGGNPLTDPIEGIEAIWGSSGTLVPIPDEGPGEKALVLVLFSMSVGRDAGDSTPVGHSSAMLSFRIFDGVDGES